MSVLAAAAPARPRPGGPGTWLRPVWAGVALLLAGAPVGAVVQGATWWGHAAGAVALVVAVGLLAGLVRPAAAVTAAAAQLAALAVLVTALFTRSGVLGVLPGPAAVAELATLVADAATEIRTEVAPVPATPAMLLLVTVAFGVTAVAVHAVAVGAGAPAAAGVLLLAVFSVPAALADDLLPAWVLAAGAAGFGLLLLARPGRPGRLPWRAAAGAVAVVAVAVVAALGAGVVAAGVGTAGRFPGTGGTGAGRVGEIGLSPFTTLRGELQQGTPTELFRVAGLPRPAYLRALTLSTYVPDGGWQLRRPGPGVPLPGELPPDDGAGGGAGDRASVRVENVGFRDYWLPVYGLPLGVAGPSAGVWTYDPLSGTAYSSRPYREDGWTQEALLAAPTAGTLRSGSGTAGVDPAFLSTDGVDPRVAAIAREVAGDAPTGFDRAVALSEWFTGPDSPFTYDLATAPGNGDDALVEFLTTGRRGYCEQFASAMAVMLRTLGVPARVAVGFTGGRDGPAGVRTVSTSDAHAWVEAWFPAAGWTTFDPTPLTDGRAIVPPYVAQAAGEGGADEPQPTAEPVPSAAPEEPVAPQTAAAPATPVEPAAQEPDGPAAATVVVALLTVLVIAGAAAGPAVWRARLRRRRLAAADAGGAGAAGAAWAELLAESADRGAPGHASDTVRTAAARMVRAHGLDGRAGRALDQVVTIVEECWYGGVDPAPATLSAPVRTVAAALRAAPVPLHRRLFPASVVTRGGVARHGASSPVGTAR